MKAKAVSNRMTSWIVGGLLWSGALGLFVAGGLDRSGTTKTGNASWGCHPNGTCVSTPAGGERITYMNAEGIGPIAVRITLPQTPRYADGAPIVVNVNTFFTARTGFSTGAPFSGEGRYLLTDLGFIYVAYLWPGEQEPATGAASDGVFDYGGPTDLAALRHVLRFVTGEDRNVDGCYFNQLLGVTPLTHNVGLYAFSHAGIAGTNVLALYGSQLHNVRYLVGRENPTLDALSCLEAGYWIADAQPALNPCYHPENYAPTTIDIDYSTVGWLDQALFPQYPGGRPYFAIPNEPDHVLCEKLPNMWGKRYYSIALTQALVDNGALTQQTWPADLATVQETQQDWPFRTTVNNYPDLQTQCPSLKVMLMFGKDDHVQPALDKPHIHQAYDGFRTTAGLWTRLNPDRAYVEWVTGQPEPDFPDNPANWQPGDWSNARPYGHPHATNQKRAACLAALLEMADRVHEDIWDDDLVTTLVK